jgi:hypothetical protein
MPDREPAQEKRGEKWIKPHFKPQFSITNSALPPTL